MRTDANGALFDNAGRPSRVMYYTGPLLKARGWECTAVPELRLAALELADPLGQRLAITEYAPTISRSTQSKEVLMKTTLRFISISLVLGLAGALTAAWGAESVINLINHGENIQNKVKSAKAAQDDVNLRNKKLVATGKQLVADQQQLQQGLAAYQKQNAAVKSQIADYKSKCEKKQLNQDTYKACKEQLAQINVNIAAVNAIPAKLNKQQNDFNARANKYNQDTKDLQAMARTAAANYSNALSMAEQWEYKASTRVADPGFQPYAKKAGCPDVRKQPKTISGILKMNTEILVCLKKVVGTN